MRWRLRSPGWFTVGHCAIAGALQLAAVCVALAAHGRPIPRAASLVWAGVGLAVVASIAALVTIAAITISRPCRPLAAAAVVGIAYYGVLPVLSLGPAVWPLAPLLPVAILWHLAFSRVPVRDLATLPGGWPGGGPGGVGHLADTPARTQVRTQVSDTVPTKAPQVSDTV